VVTALLCVASLTNLAFPHIMRARFMRPNHAASRGRLVSRPSPSAPSSCPIGPRALRPFLLAGSAYFLALCVVQSVRTYHHNHQHLERPGADHRDRQLTSLVGRQVASRPDRPALDRPDSAERTWI